MTDLSDDAGRTGTGRGVHRPALGLGLDLVGVVVVGFWLVVDGVADDAPAWVWLVAGLALVAWVVRAVVTRHDVLVAAAAVMVLAGSAVVVPTGTLLVVPVIVGVVALQVDRRLPIRWGVLAAVVAAVVVAGGAVLGARSVAGVAGALGGLLLGVLIGISRRQLRVSQDRERRAEEDQRRARLVADRARAARDVHDVLAHSLGGLVLQLDAVEALLEAGRTAEAATRAAAARALAADGLAEARRAVAVLRDPDDADPLDRSGRPSGATGRTGGLATLVDAHRGFGATIEVRGDPSLPDVDDRHRAAVAAVAREALSNARRHAPAATVVLTVARDGGAVTCTIANPLPHPGTGGRGAADPDADRGRTPGHGLVGMRERFAELDDASTVTASTEGDAFVVRTCVPVGAPVART